MEVGLRWNYGDKQWVLVLGLKVLWCDCNRTDCQIDKAWILFLEHVDPRESTFNILLSLCDVNKRDLIS